MNSQQWPSQQAPREKLLQHGAESLSDAELLAIFLRTGVKDCPVMQLSTQLLQQYGGLRQLLNSRQEQFCQGHGLGTVKFVQLKAVLEMAKRYLLEEISQKPLLNSSQLASQFLLSKMVNLGHEVFSCLFLDNQHYLIDYQELFHGTINQAPVFPREIAKKALQLNAAAVILAHNHPSGVAEPSLADKNITNAIQSALNLLDISVIDHLVVGYNQVYSFAEHGLI